MRVKPGTFTAQKIYSRSIVHIWDLSGETYGSRTALFLRGQKHRRRCARVQCPDSLGVDRSIAWMAPLCSVGEKQCCHENFVFFRYFNTCQPWHPHHPLAIEQFTFLISDNVHLVEDSETQICSFSCLSAFFQNLAKIIATSLQPRHRWWLLGIIIPVPTI
jgi:hypothetical protein